jgi:hypothetical protein
MKKPSVFTVIRVGAYLLLFGNMIISYYHALDLARDLVRLPGELLPHVWVVSLDLVFVLSVIVLSQTGGRGFLPWLFFLLGLTFTGWSNIRESVLRGDVEGTIVNGGTVVALLILELLLRWMERNREMFGQDEEDAQDAAQSLTHDEDVAQHSHIEPHTAHDELTHSMIEPHTSHSEDSLTQNAQESTHGSYIEMARTRAVHAVSHISHNDPHTAQEVVLFAASHDERHTEEEESTHTQDEIAQAHSHTESDPHTPQAEDSHTKCVTQTAQEDPHTSQLEVSAAQEQPHTSHDESSRTHASQNELCEDEEEIRTIAESMREELGKLPSIRKLAENANCSQWKARKVLSAMRKAS